jgi:hypothetical protein
VYLQIRNKAGNYGNHELQWYSPTQVNVSNGNLVITAIKESFGVWRIIIHNQIFISI